MYQGLDVDDFDYITIKIEKTDEFGWTAEEWRKANLYEKVVCKEEEENEK